MSCPSTMARDELARLSNELQSEMKLAARTAASDAGRVQSQMTSTWTDPDTDAAFERLLQSARAIGLYVGLEMARQLLEKSNLESDLEALEGEDA